jgi:hypothetical protein
LVSDEGVMAWITLREEGLSTAEDGHSDPVILPALQLFHEPSVQTFVQWMKTEESDEDDDDDDDEEESEEDGGSESA